MKSDDVKVIFLGPKFTFSHEAACKLFPHAQYFYELHPRQIFSKVDSGDMDYGILPVENSATGIVTEFYPLRLSLRRLDASGYTVFQGQTGGGSALPVSDHHTYNFTVPAFSMELSGDLSLTMNNVGTVISVDSLLAAWTENGTFTIRIQDGTRPYSGIAGIPLSLRSIIPDILTIPDNGSAGSINLEVGGDVGPWDWFDYEDGLVNSDLTAPDTLGSSTLTISWDAGALEPDETGTGMVTVKRSDGSAPASTVALQTVVNPAPPVPVACWPILAAMLAVVAVILIMSQKHRTVG